MGINPMGIRSEFCCFFTFPKEKIENFKNEFKKYMIELIDENDIYLLKNFYEITNTLVESQIGFCFYNEYIKFEFLKPKVDRLLNFFDELKEDLNLDYEAQELCTEFLESNDYRRNSDDDNNDMQLFIISRLDGIPENEGISLMEWINKD